MFVFGLDGFRLGIKRTVSVIFSDLTFIERQVRFTKVPSFV